MNEQAYKVTGKLAEYFITPIDHERARIETAEPFKVNNVMYEFSHATIKYCPARTYDTTGDIPEGIQFSYANGEYRPVQKAGTMIAPTPKAFDAIEADINAAALALFKSAKFTRDGIITALITANVHATDNAAGLRKKAEETLARADRLDALARTYDQRITALEMSTASAKELRDAINRIHPEAGSNTGSYEERKAIEINLRNHLDNYFERGERYEYGKEALTLAYVMMQGTKASTIAPVNIFSEPERLTH